MINKTVDKLKNSFAILKENIHWFIFESEQGELSWYLIFRLAFKNLTVSLSRTTVTLGAIAIGTGAVVFLVSFAYGLQDIVTQRLVQPNSMRIADVQSSSTALSLTPQTLKEMGRIAGIKSIAPAISLAGSFGYHNSKVDVVVIGAENKYLDFAHITPLYGKLFSGSAEKKGAKNKDIDELLSLIDTGEVAGAETEKQLIKKGDQIDGNKIRYRIDDDIYLPLRKSPENEGEIIGYIKGSLFASTEGVEVWGDSYSSVSTVGKAYQNLDGKWMGRWIKTTMPLNKEIIPGEYQPKLGENGTQESGEGYIWEANVKVLTYDQIVSEKQIDSLLKRNSNGGSEVLGEATGSASASESADIYKVSLEEDKSSTDAAALESIVKNYQAKSQASASASLAIVEVKKKDGKEILISTGLLNSLKLKPEKVINQEVDLSYIVSGNLISGLAGRVITKPIKYKIVGVVKEDKQPLIFTPLADLESMGINKFTTVKFMAEDEKVLAAAREKIESMGFMTQSIVDTLLQVDRLFRLMRFLLGAFGAIAFIVAIFGMFNTLTVSLLERTREIGVMKTLGTTDKDVIRLFLAESLIIGMVGGIIGIILGFVLGQSVNLMTSFFRIDKTINLFKSPPGFLITILLVSMMIGVLTGFYPAKRAKEISPLNALRYE